VVEAVRAGRSPVLVIRGDPGVGKTVLLEYLAARARGSGCRLAWAAGVPSEMELVFAGLHQLCRPMLGRAQSLPGPQQDALRTAFGLASGPPPNRFLLGLAVLSLLSAETRHRPLVCLVDDQQWLDRASAQVLGFVARRLRDERAGLVFAVRDPGADLAGLPELEVGGLPEDDARVLLESALTAPLDARVRDLIVAESFGNPLALLELPRGLGPAELAGGFGLPSARPLASRIEDSFARQLDAIPADTRQLLQLAAADQSGDPALARSAAYRSAPFTRRQRLHAALAEATGPAADPDRRAWHRAEAAPGPDEVVAAELERDRRPAVHQLPHRAVPPEQGLRQARYRLSPGTAHRPRRPE
jgi:hypothetical protein